MTADSMDRLDLLNADTKTCRDCGQVKPVDAFGPNNRAKDGRQSYCRPCHRRRNRERREKHRSRGAVAYPPGKLCSRCGVYGVVILDPDTGKPSTRLGSNWSANSSASDGLNGWCARCASSREDRRPRRLRTCPDCPDQEPRSLTNFGRVLHGDGTQSFSDYCKLHHMMNGGTKPCGGCGVWKPATAYSGHATKTDRLNSWCADCMGEYRAENREAIATQKATYYAAYRQTDHGRAVATARNHRRRARIALADHGCCTPEAMEAVKRINGGRCVICNSSDNITIDHVYAISTRSQDSDRSGLHCIQALLPLCHFHNTSRQDKTMHNWLVRLATDAGYTQADAVEYARSESVRLSGLTLTCPDLADPDAFAPPIVGSSDFRWGAGLAVGS